jgi:hypothetical protein
MQNHYIIEIKVPVILIYINASSYVRYILKIFLSLLLRYVYFLYFLNLKKASLLSVLLTK